MLYHPGDSVASGLDGQFLLGADLMVVPIFDDGHEPVRRRFYLPDGRWTDLRTETAYNGPGWHDATVPLERMPVFARDGAVVPRVALPARLRHTDELAELPWDLHVFGTGDHDAELVGFDGTLTRVRVRGSRAEASGSQPVYAKVVRHVG